MSRRSATTLTIQLRLRVPPGSNAAQLVDYITRALRAHKTSGIFTGPISAIDLDSMQIKVAKRETVYL